MNIQLITKKHKSLTRTIRNKFIAKIDPERTSSFFVLQQTNKMVSLLDRWTQNLVEEGAVVIFDKEQAEAVRKLPRGSKAEIDDRMFNAINARTLRMMLFDRGLGLVHILRNATGNLKKQVRTIIGQAKMMKDMGRLIGDAVGDLAKDFNESKDRVIQGLSHVKASTIGSGDVFSNIANFGRIGNVPIDVHVDMVLRTKSAQIRTIARRNIWLRYGYDLVQIGNRRSEKPTPCHLYIGRVFALSHASALQYDVPHVSELPAGGAPFHPNCKHEEELSLPSTRSKRNFTRPPDWALNAHWDSIKREYRKAGGEDFAMGTNPNFRVAKKKRDHHRN
jgi:hypothetical protein